MIVNLVLILLLFIGLGLIVYPAFSDYWNSFHQSRVIAHYSEDVANIDEDKYNAVLEAAKNWNYRLATGEIIEKKKLSDREVEEYNSVLDPLSTGMIGYIEIPNIACFLGIYHGTSNAVLQIATGHLEWSSFPVGGESTHSVISGHRGLPSAKLFSDLDKLKPGDIFDVYVLNEVYRYEVDLINIVEPSDMSNLNIVPGGDYITLVTCTPYGVNTHRLLVRGKRVETVVDRTLHFTSEATQIDTIVVAAVLSIPILFLLVIYVFLSGGKRDTIQREKIKKEALSRILNHQGLVAENDQDMKKNTKMHDKAKTHQRNRYSSVDDFNQFIE